jgi:hypothetical protein
VDLGSGEIHMFKQSFQWAAVALPVFSILFAGGCGVLPSHPNQINTFDGATYDTLLLAHGALTALDASVSTSYPKYTATFNQAAAAYGVAYTAYASFRTTPSTQAEVTVTINNLTVAIVALENAFEIDMGASTASIAEIRARAKKMRSSVGQSGISVSDLLTELEIAAAVANTIPRTGPYAQLAELVVETTSAALVAETNAVSQPIDLTQIAPIPAIQ